MAIPNHIKRIRELVGHSLILAPSSTAFVVSSKDNILVVKSAETSTWTLPGGMVEPSETPVDTLVRETYEETGYYVRPISVLAVLGGDVGFRRTYSNGDVVEFSDTLFLCEVESFGREKLDPEVTDSRFIPITSLAHWSYPLSAVSLLHAARNGRTIVGRDSGQSYDELRMNRGTQKSDADLL